VCLIFVCVHISGCMQISVQMHTYGVACTASMRTYIHMHICLYRIHRMCIYVLCCVVLCMCVCVRVDSGSWCWYAGHAVANGVCAVKGWEGVKDPHIAVPYFLQAAQNGHPAGMAWLGWCLLQGLGVSQVLCG